MENLNRVLLENVLPAHVAEHFLARSLKNEVRQAGLLAGAGPWAGRLEARAVASVPVVPRTPKCSSPALA